MIRLAPGIPLKCYSFWQVFIATTTGLQWATVLFSPVAERRCQSNMHTEDFLYICVVSPHMVNVNRRASYNQGENIRMSWAEPQEIKIWSQNRSKVFTLHMQLTFLLRIKSWSHNDLGSLGLDWSGSSSLPLGFKSLCQKHSEVPCVCVCAETPQEMQHSGAVLSAGKKRCLWGVQHLSEGLSVWCF